MQAPKPVKRAVQKVASSDRFARVAPKVVPPIDRFVSKATKGRIMLSQWVVPSIVLTSTGAKSGQQRRSPLAAVLLRGDIYVVASNFGGEHHPAWSYNLIANPDAMVTMRARDRKVKAHLLTHEQKAEVWPELTKAWPPYDRYVERSGRDLRVFRLATTS
ncbi:MAG: nitroreductase family deazaflavin-dependent oxidoreductase [Actinomycetia bacterium]|nr:nitroreductase family deazaflavin-dependent oxidoreductase [Actinomycetes bacterium]